MLLLHISDLHFRKGEVGSAMDPNVHLRNELVRDAEAMCKKLGRIAVESFFDMVGVVDSSPIAPISFTTSRQSYVDSHQRPCGSWSDTACRQYNRARSHLDSSEPTRDRILPGRRSQGTPRRTGAYIPALATSICGVPPSVEIDDSIP